MNIHERLDRLAARRTDQDLFEAAAMSYESYRSLDAPEAVKYIIGSMQPIDRRYTEITLEQGVRVRDQLKKKLASSVAYRFQGSVTTDTHIRQHSDIDLLVLVGKFTFCLKPLEPSHPYKGDTAQDLRDLRSSSRTALRDAFPAATVDDSGSRSIELSGGSLARKVDVVPAAFLDTIDYERTKDEIHRGVEVFDKTSGRFSANYPFRNKAEIEQKDRRCGGGMRKAARFMKTLKADSSDRVKLSSYDITAIAWNIPDNELSYGMPWDLKIFYSCRRMLQRIVADEAFKGTLWVPDGSRLIFGTGYASIDAAEALLAETDEFAAELERTIPLSARIEPKLGAAGYGVQYPIYEHRVSMSL